MKTNAVPQATEQQIVNSIIGFLNYSGHYVWRNNSGAVISEYKGKKRFWKVGLKGSADIIGIHKKTGQFIAIEVKRPGNKATEIQLAFLEEIKNRGGIAFVAFSMEEVEAHFNKLNNL